MKNKIITEEELEDEEEEVKEDDENEGTYADHLEEIKRD